MYAYIPSYACTGNGMNFICQLCMLLAFSTCLLIPEMSSAKCDIFISEVPLVYYGSVVRVALSQLVFEIYVYTVLYDDCATIHIISC